MRPILAALLALVPHLAQAAETPCHADIPCILADRSYHVKEPDGWDGVTPLPVLLHFHGWGRQGTLIVRHPRISGATRRRGVLLLAPNGIGKTWDFWGPGSPDSDFAAAVIEDAATRYPVDRDRIFVSGYSYGGAMAWRFACERGAGIAALLAVSGSIDQGETCATMPTEVRHVHGLKDTVMRFPFGPGGDTAGPVALWRRQGDCGAAQDQGAWNVTPTDTFMRRRWDCAAGRRVTLDVHGGGHWIPKGWIGRQLDQLLGRPPAYP